MHAVGLVQCGVYAISEVASSLFEKYGKLAVDNLQKMYYNRHH